MERKRERRSGHTGYAWMHGGIATGSTHRTSPRTSSSRGHTRGTLRCCRIARSPQSTDLRPEHTRGWRMGTGRATRCRHSPPDSSTTNASTVCSPAVMVQSVGRKEPRMSNHSLSLSPPPVSLSLSLCRAPTFPAHLQFLMMHCEVSVHVGQAKFGGTQKENGGAGTRAAPGNTGESRYRQHVPHNPSDT